MAEFRISGIWKNSQDVITHYAVHTVSDSSVTRAEKMTKVQAITLLETRGNSATTWIWNYTREKWLIGEKVEVINGSTGKYLRSNHDNKVSNNLAHLIDFDWIKP